MVQPAWRVFASTTPGTGRAVGKEGVNPGLRRGAAISWPSHAAMLIPLFNILEFLRSGAFITKQRAVVWSVALLLGFAAAIAFLAITARGLNDHKNRPLGTDFSGVYAAGSYAREGNALAPFDPPLQHAREQAIFGKDAPFISWQYPPFVLPVAASLAFLPYLSALTIWQLSTFVLYLGSVALLLRKYTPPYVALDRSWVLLAIAFPAVFVNLIHGQNGFLSAALLAGGIAWLDDRPIVAGTLFGLLAYKPQLFPLIPLALIVDQRWRALAATTLTVLALACIGTAAFGTESWSAFLASAQFAQMAVLERGAMGFEKIQSVFALVRLWHGSPILAYVLQGVAGLAAVVLLVTVWHGRASFPDKCAALCFAAFLTTPYCVDYDLIALAPAIALLAAQGFLRGFRPYEKSLLVLLWLVPIVTRGTAGALFLPLGTISILLAAAFIAIHARQTAKSQITVSTGLVPDFAQPTSAK